MTVQRPTDRGEHRALHGLTRSLIANMVEGVTDGFEKRLEIQGVGYRAQLKGKSLELALGYSHPVSIEPPDGIEFEVPQPTEVIVRGIDKQLVGQVAADIRKRRPPEPYKGKGIRYRDEHVMRKVGKRACHDGYDQAPAAPAPPPPCPCPHRRQRRASAPLRLPLQPRCLRPARRRRRRSAPWPRSTGPSRSCANSRQASRRSGPESCSPSGPRKPGSRPASLTAVATSSTAASKL